MIEPKSKLISRQFNSISPTFAQIKTNIDELEDEVAFFNLGQYTLKKYMTLLMTPNEVSSWDNYPFQYKFMSLHVLLNMDI